MGDQDERSRWRVVYTVPGMDAVEVHKDIPYKAVGDRPLCLDVYYPPAMPPNSRLPAVVFISGGGELKDWGTFVSYGQLAGASGLIGVTFDTQLSRTWDEERLPAGDVDDLLAYVLANAAALRIDSERLALWAFSAGAPFGLRTALRDMPPWLRCVVVYYGLLDTEQAAGQTGLDLREFSALHHLTARPEAVPPLFVARAGQDRPALNASIDRFVAAALAHNVSVAVANHPTGPHGFSVRDASPRSREILRSTLAFLGTHLGTAPA
jgi:acetyl esterase/lipase